MSEARYPYVHVAVTAEAVELVSLELFELGALGIEERDQSTLVRSEGADTDVTLVASFADEPSASQAAAHFAGRFSARVSYVVGDDWRDGWRAYFKPLRVGERLVVKPSWEEYEKSPGELVLTLDPGQAFGTGTHESTQLLLAQLEARVTPGVRVLDVGTGSGILAIACLLLGASRADATDVDPLAVDAARENAEINGVGARLFASNAPLASLPRDYRLLLANIEARVLIPEARALAARVAPFGLLLLSGLLHEQVAQVRAAYPEFEELARPVKGDWSALVLRKVKDV